jgi:voltage-dependent calcium channel T type alpha-1G
VSELCDFQNTAGSVGLLSPPTSQRRRGSSVMFNEYVILHTPPTIPEPNNDINSFSLEKMTQAGDGSIWQVNLPQNTVLHSLASPYNDYSELSLNDAMTCQELLAFSVAFSAALPTGHTTLESFYSTLARNPDAVKPPADANNMATNNGANNAYPEDFSCCYELYQQSAEDESIKKKKKSRPKIVIVLMAIIRMTCKVCYLVRKYVKMLVDHKRFQQGILLAILINTLSMGIEYHNQPEELTAIVETSNVVFSIIFAIEMLLKVTAEGPFKYVANGFNVFDGVIVVLR